MAPRSRIVAFGSAAALVLAGALCALFVPGLTGELLTIGLMASGLAGALLLVFLEIGLSEERAVAREQAQRRRRELRAIRSLRAARLRQRARRPQ
jgi:hypothetical protein